MVESQLIRISAGTMVITLSAQVSRKVVPCRAPTALMGRAGGLLYCRRIQYASFRVLPSTVNAMPFVNLKLDVKSAQQVAEFFAANGRYRDALAVVQACSNAEPQNPAHRFRMAELTAEVSFDADLATVPLGTFERGRHLLRLISTGFFSTRLEDAYFSNLESLADRWVLQRQEGIVFLGVGTGRCGSTSLAAQLNVPGNCVTHENPPFIHWQPTERQIQFHIRRFSFLRRYFAVVGDIAHWWLPSLEAMSDAFPDLRVIALQRESDTCIASFERLLGSGHGSYNHWHDHGYEYWRPSVWAATYPSYPFQRPTNVDDQHMQQLRRGAISTYVRDYYELLQPWRERLGNRLLWLRTEDLGQAETIQRVTDLLNIPRERIAQPQWLNRSDHGDSCSRNGWV